MAIQAPGISFLRGYDKPDILKSFASGHAWGEGLKNEDEAKKALEAYVESLYMGGAAPGAPDQMTSVIDPMVSGAHDAARDVRPPSNLVASLDAKGYQAGDPAGRAMKFFIDKGYTKQQAAGIVGNLMHESGLDVAALNPGDGADGSNSIGIAQWNGPRAEALHSYASTGGLDVNDLETQLGFIDHELRSTEGDAYQRLMAATNPIQAAAAFAGYERPQGWTAENPYGALGWGSRAKEAARLAGMDFAGAGGAPQTAQNAAPRLPKDILASLVRNPATREFGLGLAQSGATKAIEVNGRLVNPVTGEVIADFSDPKAPTVVTRYNEQTGQEEKLQWNAEIGDWEPFGGQKAPTNGLTVTTNPDGTTTVTQGGSGKLTEGQSKDVVYYTRGTDANAQLGTELEKALTDLGGRLSETVPLGLGNYVRTPEYRQAKVAADNFLAAILRKDTGAAVTPVEFELYGGMFLPVPGDDTGTIEMKRRMRSVALLAIKSGLGTAEAVATANEAILGTPLPEDVLKQMGGEAETDAGPAGDYPEGTVIANDAGDQLVMRNGEWVPL